MMKKIVTSASLIRNSLKNKPLFGMITGTGLAGLADAMEIDQSLPYEKIPYFPKSTVPGHTGVLLTGNFAGKPAIVMNGRFHLYEGYTVHEITFPVRVMAYLGVKYLFISSAAGGLDPDFQPGELMLVKDHINLTGENPLTGINLPEFGPMFPDMASAYDKDLITLAKEKALTERINLNQGVYAGLTGPSLETPAETRFLKLIGADAVGMSTVNEVIAAVHSGLKVLAIVAITNVNLPDCIKTTSIEEIINNAEKASSSLVKLFSTIIKDIKND